MNYECVQFFKKKKRNTNLPFIDAAALQWKKKKRRKKNLRVMWSTVSNM